jgi:nucleotide-binding universal stress UspA family protein
MPSPESIVVGTDGSETAERAVDRAGSLARALGATVHVVSAHSKDAARLGAVQHNVALVEAGREGERIHVQEILDRAQEQLAKLGVESEAHLSTREPGRALVEVADDNGAQMIVVGNRGMTGAKRLLGSVPNHVSHHAHCDVLIVRTN